MRFFIDGISFEFYQTKLLRRHMGKLNHLSWSNLIVKHVTAKK